MLIVRSVNHPNKAIAAEPNWTAIRNSKRANMAICHIWPDSVIIVVGLGLTTDLCPCPCQIANPFQLQLVNLKSAGKEGYYQRSVHRSMSLPLISRSSILLEERWTWPSFDPNRWSTFARNTWQTVLVRSNMTNANRGKTLENRARLVEKKQLISALIYLSPHNVKKFNCSFEHERTELLGSIRFWFEADDDAAALNQCLDICLWRRGLADFVRRGHVTGRNLGSGMKFNKISLSWSR